MKKIKVLLVEDHTMTRLGLRMVLEREDNIKITGEASDGIKAVELAGETKPDVILMDIGLPFMDGIEATSTIKKKHPEIRVLIYTSRENEDDVFSALSAGADGYIMKGAEEDRLITAITVVSEGTAWLDPAIAGLVLSNVRKEKARPEMSENNFNLTGRECEVLALIAEGLDNKQIAERLIVSLSTARAHVHNILQKLYVKNKHEATVKAFREGLIK